MIALVALAGLIGEPLVYESFRTLGERAVQDDYQVSVTSPLNISGTGAGGSEVSGAIGGTAILRGNKLTIGLYLPDDPTKFLAGDGTWQTPGGSSPLTTKGDLWGYSTVNARVPVGTDGYILTADSTQALGVKWAAAAGTGTVTSVSASTGITCTPNPIVGAGTVGLTIPVVPANGGTGTTTVFTAGSVVFAGPSGVYAQDNTKLFYDDTNNRLGLNTTGPNELLDVRGKMRAGDDSHNNYPGDSPVFYFSTALTNVVGNWTATNAGGNGAQFTMRADGTGAGSKMANANLLGLIGFRGKDDGGFAAISSAKFQATATEAWFTTAHGTKLEFYTTPNGSTSSALAMTIDQSGYVGIGTTAPFDPLTVYGNFNATPSATHHTASHLAVGVPSGVMLDFGANGAASSPYGFIQTKHDSADVAYDLHLCQAGGNVAIGTIYTTFPSHPLTVGKTASDDIKTVAFFEHSPATNTWVGGSAIALGAYADAAVFANGYASRLVSFTNPAISYGSRLQIQTSRNAVGVWNPGLFMDETGKAGFGTTAPGVNGVEISGNATTGADGYLRLQGYASDPNYYTDFRQIYGAGGLVVTQKDYGQPDTVLTMDKGYTTIKLIDKGGQVFNVLAYGAVADAIAVSDGAMDNNVTFNLTCATSTPFTSADVGKPISVTGGAAAGVLYATITGFTSSSVVTLSAKNTSGAAISGQQVSYGTDNTTAFTNAIAAAQTYPNSWYGTVFVPRGAYRISTHFTVTGGVLLRGESTIPSDSRSGSQIHFVEGAGSGTGTAGMVLNETAGCEHLVFVRPNQTTTGNPLAFPFDVQATAFTSVVDCAFLGSYQGIDAASYASGDLNSGIHLRGIYGDVAYIGIDLDQSYDVTHVSKVHFYPYWTQDATRMSWKHSNAIGMRFGRGDWMVVEDFFTYGVGTGMQFNHSSAGGGGTSGCFTDIQFDACKYGIDATETGYQGAQFTNLTVGNGGALDGYGIRTNYNASYKNNITVAGFQAWGSTLWGVYHDSLGHVAITNGQFIQQTGNGSYQGAYVGRDTLIIEGSQFRFDTAAYVALYSDTNALEVKFRNNVLNTCTITLVGASTVYDIENTGTSMQSSWDKATNQIVTAAASGCTGGGWGLYGDIAFGASAATTATAGGGGALPALPVAYIGINIGGTPYKIPVYNV